MAYGKRAFGLRKWKVLLSVFHVIFLVITLAGISAMYLNGGYGKGIRWIYDETYEDSDAFCSQLGIDISNIFTYIGYKDMFETNGVLDMHKPIVRIIDGPGVDEDMTLDQIVRYAKIRGYYLGEDFTVQGSPMAMDDDDMEITVEYKSAKTDLADVDGLETRMTKEEMALDILDRLGKYYTIYYNFISNNTNVRFRILYKSNDGREVVYTNVPSMSLDELRGFGNICSFPEIPFVWKAILQRSRTMRLLFWKHGIPLTMTRIIWWSLWILPILILIIMQRKPGNIKVPDPRLSWEWAV